MTSGSDWRGRVGDVWAEEHARTEQAFSGIAAALGNAIAAVAPHEGRAVDLGCGVGGTTLALAGMRPHLRVTGIDLSAALIAVARRSAAVAGAPTVSGAQAPAFVCGDIVELVPALAPLDLLVSRHGLMFFANPDVAFTALRKAAAADAPLVFSCFAARGENDWVTAPEAALTLDPMLASGYAPGPFALGDEVFTRALLERSGWRDVRIVRHRVDYPVGSGDAPVESALAFYRRIGPLASLLAASQNRDRDRYEAVLRDLFAARIREGAVTFSATILVVTARAGKEAA
ncbi:methyltransferase domain-containing protein [Sphingomonas endophytica]|uniref:SAM-dependent methyltransferase n=1 Tax=Sphingomonas endophytica TaxID=869719 RepID=A0ABR6N2C7_9SPHN|nr:class I SAM-dependent methyltransferase [Sphingomonas endophytica]MBB5724939.1 SAM-dependent methyltransferase [Sphingomonas endophytica]